MKLIDFYIGSSFLKCFFLLIFILAVLFSFFELLSQLDDVGRGSYRTINAVIFVLFTLPKRMLDLMPVSALLGGVVALGLMADRCELLAMQAAGMSIPRICAPVFATGMLLIVTTGVFAEMVAPNMEQQARSLRAQALGEPGVVFTRHGVWARRESSYIHVDKMLGQGIAAGLDIFEFDAQGRLKIFTHAHRAENRNNQQWTLQGITQRVITDQGITTRTMAQLTLESFLGADQVALMELPPYSLSTADLIRYIKALQESGQNADQYVLALWRKLTVPLTTGAMILLSLSFVFGPTRNISVSYRITMASFIGISLYLAEKLLMHLGLLLNVIPFITALSPVLLISSLALWRLRKIV
jgi:lipopolysaccharide export system permease protein